MKETGKPDIFLFRVICIVYLLSFITLCSSPVLAASSEERLLDFAKKARKTTISENEKPADFSKKDQNIVSKNDMLASFAKKAQKTTVSKNKKTQNSISENDRLASFAKKVQKTAVSENKKTQNSISDNDRLAGFTKKASKTEVHSAPVNDRLSEFAEKASGITGGMMKKRQQIRG